MKSSCGTGGGSSETDPPTSPAFPDRRIRPWFRPHTQTRHSFPGRWRRPGCLERISRSTRRRVGDLPRRRPRPVVRAHQRSGGVRSYGCPKKCLEISRTDRPEERPLPRVRPARRRRGDRFMSLDAHLGRSVCSRSLRASSLLDLIRFTRENRLLPCRWRDRYRRIYRQAGPSD